MFLCLPKQRLNNLTENNLLKEISEKVFLYCLLFLILYVHSCPMAFWFYKLFLLYYFIASQLLIKMSILQTSMWRISFLPELHVHILLDFLSIGYSWYNMMDQCLNALPMWIYISSRRLRTCNLWISMFPRRTLEVAVWCWMTFRK